MDDKNKDSRSDTTSRTTDDKNKDSRSDTSSTHQRSDRDSNYDEGSNNHNQTRRGSSMAKEGLEKEAYDIGSKVRDDVDRGKEYAEDAIASLEKKVKNNPLMSVGVSVLIGMVLSTFMRAR